MIALLAIAGLAARAQSYGEPPTPRVVAFVQVSLQRGDLVSASALVAQYRKLNGDTPEALDALSWLARGELSAGNFADAIRYSREIRQASQTALATRKLDAEPYLPIALGAAYEVEAQALVAQKQQREAIALLKSALRTWRETSIADRLQKNLNELTLEGTSVPRLEEAQWIGAKPAPLSALRGKVVLLFFWAHWCADCKAEAPVIAHLAAELGPKGLVVLAPTRLYGYTAEEEHAAPSKEMPFIEKVYAHYYAAIPNAGVPVNTANFDRFGVSTTPTLVLIDRLGLVKLYHPGILDGAGLRAAIEPLLGAAR